MQQNPRSSPLPRSPEESVAAPIDSASFSPHPALSLRAAMQHRTRHPDFDSGAVAPAVLCLTKQLESDPAFRLVRGKLEPTVVAALIEQLTHFHLRYLRVPPDPISVITICHELAENAALLGTDPRRIIRSTICSGAFAEKLLDSSGVKLARRYRIEQRFLRRAARCPRPLAYQARFCERWREIEHSPHINIFASYRRILMSLLLGDSDVKGRMERGAQWFDRLKQMDEMQPLTVRRLRLLKQFCLGYELSEELFQSRLQLANQVVSRHVPADTPRNLQTNAKLLALCAWSPERAVARLMARSRSLPFGSSTAALDSTTLEAALRGDQIAIALLYTKLRPLLCREVRVRGAHRTPDGKVVDLVGIFDSCFTKTLHIFNPERGADFVGLLRILLFRALHTEKKFHFIRRHARKLQFSTKSISEDPVLTALIEEEASARFLHRATNGWNETHLHAWQMERRGLSQSQIAHGLGIPVGTVKSSLYRAHAALRQFGVDAPSDAIQDIPWLRRSLQNRKKA